MAVDWEGTNSADMKRRIKMKCAWTELISRTAMQPRRFHVAAPRPRVTRADPLTTPATLSALKGV